MRPRCRSRSPSSTPAAVPRRTVPKQPATVKNAPLTMTTGRRKAAVARVWFRPGTGKITVNGRGVEDYFPAPTHRMLLAEPLHLVDAVETYDVFATIAGGGPTGQAGALRLGIARALIELDPEQRDTMKRAGFLTRDAREKESKKYGLKKARKAPQYSKR